MARPLSAQKKTRFEEDEKDSPINNYANWLSLYSPAVSNHYFIGIDLSFCPIVLLSFCPIGLTEYRR